VYFAVQLASVCKVLFLSKKSKNKKWYILQCTKNGTRTNTTHNVIYISTKWTNMNRRCIHRHTQTCIKHCWLNKPPQSHCMVSHHIWMETHCGPLFLYHQSHTPESCCHHQMVPVSGQGLISPSGKDLWSLIQPACEGSSDWNSCVLSTHYLQ